MEGAVNSPASVPHMRRAGVNYYVTAAGGFSRQADKGGTYVQQPNGLIQKGKRPEPGALVFVPAKDPRDRGIDFISLVPGITGILASLTTVILVLAR